MRHSHGEKHLSIEQLLKNEKLRVTPVRVKILKTLAEQEQPISAEELFGVLNKRSKKGQSFDLVTIYRNMNAFVEAGLIATIDLGTGRSLFEFVGGNKGHHHHHVVCRSCNKIEHLDICGMDLHIKMLEGMGYKNLSHSLEFFGICRACK